MNNLCADIGCKSINHHGEQLCGDHVDIVRQDENSVVIVLADGLGSGVKASILSTLTSKIISTMISAGISLEECVSTIAATLPICSVRKVAYSTFTIINITDNDTAELIQFDNPPIILFRDNKPYDYPKTEISLDGKKIYKSVISLCENDIFVAMSDGCPHAGIGTSYNLGWQQEDIISFLEPLTYGGFTAKTLATILVDECFGLYCGEPGDDATACVVKIRKRSQVNILFGPPANKDDDNRMMTLFFSKEGKHIICGGTTAAIAANYLKKPLKTSTAFENPDIPPISEIEGVDLVTEGVITMSKVFENAQNHLGGNENYNEWITMNDGASRLCRILFEEATDINFYVGRAINPAHQNPKLPISFSIKMQLVEELSKCLKQMGKKIKVSYF